ncbi:RPAP3 [Auxenochlorella protothecoides x Auxenochlorella symbiontica]
MEAQRRAMQQAQELQAYMKDLLKWEKDVEVKPRVRTTPAAELPPVRGSVPGGAGARNGSTGGASTRHTPPTCSTEGLREEGNEHFRKGRLNEAAASYTTSLKLKPTPAAFANRAAVYLKRREWDRAEADCSACLELDAGFVKAYHRRATAREALGDMHGAAADFEQVFCHDPSSTQAVESRARCLRAFLDSQPSNGAPSPGSQGPSGPLQVSVSLEACEPGPSPGVSLLLEQEAGGSAAALGLEGRGAEMVPLSTSYKPAGGMQQVEARLSPGSGSPPALDDELPGSHAPPGPDSVETATGLPRSLVTVVDDDRGVRNGTAAQEGVTQVDGQEDQARRVVTTAEQLPREGAGGPEVATSCPAPGLQNKTRDPSMVENQSPGALPPYHGRVPSSGVEFERAWRGSKRDPPAQAALLCAIPPARLPHLLTHVLNPELLAEVAMRVLESVARRQPSLALDLLRALRCVPRFPMLAMGLAPRQCAALRNALDGCGGLPGAEPELLKAFGLQ